MNNSVNKIISEKKMT